MCWSIEEFSSRTTRGDAVGKEVLLLKADNGMESGIGCHFWGHEMDQETKCGTSKFCVTSCVIQSGQLVVYGWVSHKLVLEFFCFGPDSSPAAKWQLSVVKVGE